MVVSFTLLHFFLFLSIFTTTIIGQTTRDECGTIITDLDQAEMQRVSLNSKRQLRNSTAYDFGIYFNVVAANMTIQGGWVPQKQIDDQITLMNTRYAGTGIRFHLSGVTRILSRYWHETVGPQLEQARDMQSLFRKGGCTFLNVYTVGFRTVNLNGYSSLPANYHPNPAFRNFQPDPTLDGIVLLFTTLPGGTSRERQGGTLVHEAGHWLGLSHTFQGGCTGSGDGVSDTAPEASAATGCPIGRRSCPNSNLPDPIHNFMDYTDENCRTEFTPGQIDAMHLSIQAYRSNPNL